MNAELLQNFRHVVEKMFNNWPNLRIAVEHGMGGRNGHKVCSAFQSQCIFNPWKNICPELIYSIRHMSFELCKIS